MNDRYLKSFLAVVDSGSFSKAEEKLFISKQALVKQIAALEEEVGYPLLVRSRRGITLTPAGEDFYNSTKNLLSMYDTTIKRGRRIAHGNTKLRIGMVQLHVLIDRITVEFSRRYPEIETQNIICPGRSPLNRLSQNIIDVAELAYSPLIAEKGFEYMKLVELPYMCLLSENHPMAKYKKLTLKELSENHVVIHTKQWSKENLEELTKAVPSLEMRSDVNEAAELAFHSCRNYGVYVTPAYYANFLTPLAAITLDTDYRREYGLVYRPYPSWQLQKFLDTAKEVYHDK